MCSLIVGFICLAVIFIGLCMPTGKFSLVQALVLPQVICFSFLQFDFLPLTYLGFKDLFFSSGYNNLAVQNTSIVPKQIFLFFGLSDTSFLSNYNATFVVLCLIPLILGFVILFILKRISQ